ncbi:MAG: hypothetical protein M3416_15075, partial [Acidobacteriota bacterium]|nr:hypothetical protein [Acidobacteriota bacterium]
MVALARTVRHARRPRARPLPGVPRGAFRGAHDTPGDAVRRGRETVQSNRPTKNVRQMRLPLRATLGLLLLAALG